MYFVEIIKTYFFLLNKKIKNNLWQDEIFINIAFL